MNAPERADRAGFAAAVRDHRAGRLREAVSAYEALLRRAPNDAEVLQLLGLALGQLGRDADAAVLLARSLELEPDRPTVLLNLAQALHATGDENAALRACERALALDRSAAKEIPRSAGGATRDDRSAAKEIPRSASGATRDDRSTAKEIPRSASGATRDDRSLAGGYRLHAAILSALGRRQEALASAGQAVRLAMQDAAAHADLGVALQAVGRESDALACFERAIALDPNLAAAHHNHAMLLGRRGDHQSALLSFDRAVALQPHNAALHSNRGNTLKELGRVQEAAQSYSLALAIEPGNPQTLHNRAVAHYLLGQYAEALRDYDSLAAVGKESAPDLVGRGAALVALGRYSEALAPLERATEHLPSEAEAHIQRGVALQNLERYAEAVESFDRALAIRPDVPPVLNNRAVALTHLGRMSEALSSLIRSLALNGTNPDTHVNMGIVLKALGRHREAGHRFSSALGFRPDDPSARFGLAFLHLTLGEFDLGWPLYEARFHVPDLGNPLRHFNFPRWSGTEPLAGKTLLVHAEQGLGDVIQFCRYLPLLAERHANVVFEVMPSLKALLGTLPGQFRIIGRGEPLPQADYHSPLLSLPLAFNTRFATIPARVPYLAPEPERVARWMERLRNLSGLRVGIAWQGNPLLEKHIWARGRSIPLSVFEPLARSVGISLVSVQKGPGVDQLRAASFADRIVDLSDELDRGGDAFVDTAAVIAGLDLVISSDTSIAHLAGALGRPVWTALALSPEWRWLLERRDNPWYPTMRLFRQSRSGDWSGVVSEIASALKELTTR